MKAHGGNPSAISMEKFGGPQMHVAPDGREGSECTAEEIYSILEKKYKQFVKNLRNKLKKDGYASWDVHDAGNNGEDGSDGQPNYDAVFMDALWQSWILNAAEVTKKYGVKGRGTVPGFVERYVNNVTEPKLDWRVILNEFVQEEINDYSFTPPDRRFSDSPFYLPDYNDTDYSVKKLLFMIDASGSMSDDDVAEVYSEVKGAIDQFNGKLQGWLGFFDGVVYPPEEFKNEEEFAVIRPQGGGGTSFDIIFDYVRDKMTDDPPVLIIILTDGYAPFPDEKAADDKPVLWILTTNDVNPPWGKVARLEGTENGLIRE
jgi:predicted metal-dependent peptidase